MVMWTDASHSHVIVTFTHCCCRRRNDDGNIHNSNNNGIILSARACVRQYEAAKRRCYQNFN